MATIADHIKPHHGNEALFYDPDNLQSLCAQCHGSAKALKEHKGLYPGCDVDGNPLDSNHWF